LVVASVTVTLAPFTAAPIGSLTVTEIAPVISCDRALPEAAISSATTAVKQTPNPG
jgi:hypothetical protein